jgi:Tol biopolymer transport system component
MKQILIIPFFLLILLSGCIDQTDQKQNDEKTIYSSEKSFYKLSDVGTNVTRLTSDFADDLIFYQNPNFFSPDNSKFLFRSTRDDGNDRLHFIDLHTGEITLLREDTSYGWRPTWSKDGKEVYVGHSGKILAINVETLNERVIDIPTNYWITFLDLSPSGNKLVFIEEWRRDGVDTHELLSVVNIDGTDYTQLYILDKVNEFFLDHPFFINDSAILFLTRGEERDFTEDYNKPYVLNLNSGNLTRLPTTCSHYDLHPDGNMILCGSDGYIIDIEGNILKETDGIEGHGVWAPDGDTFLMTGDPVPVPEGSPYFGKITIMKFSTNETYNLVSHENTYDSSLEVHIQPNAHFSRDGKYVIYQSDKEQNLDIYIVEIPE